MKQFRAKFPNERLIGLPQHSWHLSTKFVSAGMLHAMLYLLSVWVQIIRRLIQQKNLRLAQQGACQADRADLNQTKQTTPNQTISNQTNPSQTEPNKAKPIVPSVSQSYVWPSTFSPAAVLFLGVAPLAQPSQLVHTHVLGHPTSATRACAYRILSQRPCGP